MEKWCPDATHAHPHCPLPVSRGPIFLTVVSVLCHCIPVSASLFIPVPTYCWRSMISGSIRSIPGCPAPPPHLATFSCILPASPSPSLGLFHVFFRAQSWYFVAMKTHVGSLTGRILPFYLHPSPLVLPLWKTAHSLTVGSGPIFLALVSLLHCCILVSASLFSLPPPFSSMILLPWLAQIPGPVCLDGPSPHAHWYISFICIYFLLTGCHCSSTPFSYHQQWHRYRQRHSPSHLSSCRHWHQQQQAFRDPQQQ